MPMDHFLNGLPHPFAPNHSGLCRAKHPPYEGLHKTWHMKDHPWCRIPQQSSNDLPPYTPFPHDSQDVCTFEHPEGPLKGTLHEWHNLRCQKEDHHLARLAIDRTHVAVYWAAGDSHDLVCIGAMLISDKAAEGEALKGLELQSGRLLGELGRTWVKTLCAEIIVKTPYFRPEVSRAVRDRSTEKYGLMVPGKLKDSDLDFQALQVLHAHTQSKADERIQSAWEGAALELSLKPKPARQLQWELVLDKKRLGAPRVQLGGTQE